MSQIQKKNHPWNAGYDIPEYIMREGDDVRVTKGLPRGTYSLPPEGFDYAGYAVPPNVKAEVPGQGTLTTGYMPRRTIASLPEDILERKGLSGVEAMRASLPPSDNPLYEFGRKSARWFVREIKKVPKKQREEAARLLLNGLEPGLFTKVDRDAQKLVNQGVGPDEALYQALSKRFSSGMVNELVATGKKGKVKPNSLLGLGCSCCQGHQPTGGIWDAVKSVGRGGAAVFTLGLSEKGVRDFLGKGAKTIGGYACQAINHPLAEVGAAAAAGAKGAPPQAGQTGVAMAREIACPEGQVPVLMPTAPVSATPQWVMPAVIGGGVLLAVIALRK